jgi:hypothetical protein
LSWYTFNELIVQYASVKASGLSRTHSSHVDAFLLQELPVAFQTLLLPAHCPQNVVSKTICCCLNVFSISQAPANLAAGLPHPLGSGLSPRTSSGMESRGKK